MRRKPGRMAKTKIVKQLRHGQVTIPKEFREALHIERDDLLAITLTAGKLEIERVEVGVGRGAPAWARELYRQFAPVRESLRGATEEDINRAIDEALRKSRSRAR